MSESQSITISIQASMDSATFTVTFRSDLAARVRRTLRAFTNAALRVERVDATTRRIILSSNKRLTASAINSSKTILFMAHIQFRDADSFALDEETTETFRIAPLSESVFTGYRMVNASIANLVESGLREPYCCWVIILVITSTPNRRFRPHGELRVASHRVHPVQSLTPFPDSTSLSLRLTVPPCLSRSMPSLTMR